MGWIIVLMLLIAIASIGYCFHISKNGKLSFWRAVNKHSEWAYGYFKSHPEGWFIIHPGENKGKPAGDWRGPFIANIDGIGKITLYGKVGHYERQQGEFIRITKSYDGWETFDVVKKQQIVFTEDANKAGKKSNIKERMEEMDTYLTDKRKCTVIPVEDITKRCRTGGQQTTTQTTGNYNKTDEEVKFLMETAREIPKINEYSLDRLFKTEGFKLKKSFYAIMELSVVYYIHYDMELISLGMEHHRKIFINAFYDACKNMGKSMGKELTVAQLDSLIGDITLILQNDRLLNIHGFPSRLFTVSEQDAPYKGPDWVDWSANFFGAPLVSVALKEHLNIMFAEIEKFKIKLMTDKDFFDSLPRREDGYIDTNSLSDKQYSRLSKYVGSFPKNKEGYTDLNAMTLGDRFQYLEYIGGRECAILNARAQEEENNERIAELRKHLKTTNSIEADEIRDQIDILEKEYDICDAYINGDNGSEDSEWSSEEDSEWSSEVPKIDNLLEAVSRLFPDYDLSEENINGWVVVALQRYRDADMRISELMDANPEFAEILKKIDDGEDSILAMASVFPPEEYTKLVEQKRQTATVSSIRI